MIGLSCHIHSLSFLLPLTLARGRRQVSAPSSGRSTPSSIGGRRSKEPTPAEGRSSRGRHSLESQPPAKRARNSLEKPPKGRSSDIGGKRTSVGGKSAGKKTVSSEPRKGTKNSLEKGRHARSNSARTSLGNTKSSKRKLELNDRKFLFLNYVYNQFLSVKKSIGKMLELIYKSCEDIFSNFLPTIFC